MPKTSKTFIPLTDSEQSTLRKAAYGAVTLVSLAYPGTWSTTVENIAGAKVLNGATGIVGRVLSGKQKFDLKGSSTAEIADQVLPALSETIEALGAKAPTEVGEFRRAVMTAVRQAAATTRRGEIPAQADMIEKIDAALGERPAASA